MPARLRDSTLQTLAFRLALTAGGLLALAFSPILAARAGKQSWLSATWIRQPYYQQEGEDAPDPRLTHWTLVLKDDGTFTEQMENHVMETIIARSRGKYTRNGDLVTLSGVREGFQDDGYVKGHFSITTSRSDFQRFGAVTRVVWHGSAALARCDIGCPAAIAAGQPG